MQQHQQVAVIGAGVIGVCTALAIQRQFAASVRVTIFAEHFSPNTTGDVSAGLWTPYILHSTPMADIIKWSKATYDYALDLWRAGEATRAGISLQVASTLTADRDDPAVPDWVRITLGHRILDADQIALINREYNANYCSGVTFTTFIIEPQKWLPYLMDEFKSLGGCIIKRKVTSFEELNQLGKFDLIINCAGLEAKWLVDDEETQPVRGQIMRVRAPGVFHVISDDESYVIPNSECIILGGTHQEKDWDLTVHESDAEMISQRCQEFYPCLKSAQLIRHQVGLRPGRTSVRLDHEVRQFADGSKIPIIHNYGHGGSGVTLSMGCAAEARHLAGALLRLEQAKL